MHGDIGLGGPVWFFATSRLLLTVGLALFVIFDVVRRVRRGCDEAVGEGALVAFAIGEAAFPPALTAQLLQGVSLAVALAPFALATGVGYLLRMVSLRG